MDSVSISFQDLNLKMKYFSEEFEDLIENKNKILLKTISNNEPDIFKNLYSSKQLKELLEEVKHQHFEELKTIRKQQECSKNLINHNNKIKALKKSLEKLKEESIGKNELSRIEKLLEKVIEKYSQCFDMQIEVKKHATDENKFIAFTHFNIKDNTKKMNFIIDRRMRIVLDFESDSFSEASMQTLKNEAMTPYELDLNLVLPRIFDIL